MPTAEPFSPGDEIEYGFEYLVNTGDFENAKVVIHGKTTVREGESFKDTVKRIGEPIEDTVVRRVQAIRQELGN